MNIAIWYNNFIVVKNEKRKIVKFEAKKCANFATVIKDIIKYLKFHEIDGNFKLLFNDKELIINKCSNETDLFNEYFEINNLNL